MLMEYLKKREKPWKFLAPMVSNSEEAYRRLAVKYGADLCFTEMVNSKVFVDGGMKCKPNFLLGNGPLVVQICGNDPEKMLRTALFFQDKCDAIDINFGCPQEIARRGHYGSFLQDDWPLISEVVSTLSSSLSVPLFCKIRVFESISKTVEYARIFEAAGCSLLTVHGRTREQRGQNTGLASWEHIKAIKNSLKIPIIANGNMIFHKNIKECVEHTGCDGVMIAEPHLYNPAIFEGTTHFSYEILKEYLEIIQKHPGSAEPKHIKSHSFKILKKLISAHPELAPILNECSSLDDYFRFLQNLEAGEYKPEVFALDPYIRKFN